MTDKPKILAIDDEPFNLDILSEYLTEDGYHVIEAQDGVAGLQMLEKHADIRLIILDRTMPRMNGMDFLNHIKADPRFKDIPVIMQTAAATDEQKQDGIEAGVYSYITKPYRAALLLGTTRSAIHEAMRLQGIEYAPFDQTAEGSSLI